MSQETKPSVAFIGLGAMGRGMAGSLVRAGFDVSGFDINRAAVDELVAQGGRGAGSVAETVAGADVLILAVVNADQVAAVLFGEGGAAEALGSGRVVVVCSTVPAAFAVETGRRLAAMGIEMLDAPVSGGAAKAETGELSIMASGSPAAFEKTAAVLDAMAAKVYRLGEACGLGSTVKMINQLLAGVHIAAAAEAMALGTRAGADPQQLYEVISNSAGSSWMFQNRVPHMISGDYNPLSAVEIFVKDLGIVLDEGRRLRFPLPLSATAHQQFLASAAAGLGREDDAAVVKVYEKLSGISVSASGQGAKTER